MDMQMHDRRMLFMPVRSAQADRTLAHLERLDQSELFAGDPVLTFHSRRGVRTIKASTSSAATS